MIRLAPQFVLARLLAAANRGSWDPEFYSVKDALLRRFGRSDGFDVQEITHACWGYRHYGCDDDCEKCGGTGVFSRRWVFLERRLWCGCVFHVPRETVFERPPRVDIVGRIPKTRTLASREAELWLYLLCGQFAMFVDRITNSSVSCPWWYPLCSIQRVGMWARSTLGRSRCYCGRRFWAFGSDEFACRKCRSEASRFAGPHVDDEIPF